MRGGVEPLLRRFRPRAEHPKGKRHRDQQIPHEKKEWAPEVGGQEVFRV
jgi:hypothetical protein